MSWGTGTAAGAEVSRPHDAVVRRIADGGFEVLSLDVFDTTLVRDVPEPADVFLVLGAQLARAGAMWPGTPPEAFARERVAAEERARRRTRHHEVELAGIYREFPAGFLRATSPDALVAEELAVERRLLRPVPATEALVAEARARGLRIAYVSDTYFGSATLREWLGGTADPVFASCEHGCSKSAGLHAVAARALGVEPARILHVGDHPVADVEAPRRYGVATMPLPRWPAGWADAMAAEWPRTFTDRLPRVADGDRGLNALRRRAAWATDDEWERWGSIVLGPVLGGFTAWVRQRCEAEGIGHALCLMREGRLLASLLARAGAAPVAHECFVSRHAARRAAILEGSPEELREFANRSRPPLRGRVLAELGCAPDALGEPDVALAGDALRDFARGVSGSRGLRRAALETSAAARRGLVAHLRRLLPRDPGSRVAVVDLGYMGTIQLGLERIARHERLGWLTHGLYLVTGAGVHAAQATGAVLEGYLASNGQPASMAHTFLRSPETVEQSLMADCGTTLGHAPDGTPRLGPQDTAPEQADRIRRVQRGVRAWMERQCESACGWAPDPEAWRPHLQAILGRAVARPSPTELALFAEWGHDENLGSAVRRGLFEIADLHPWEAAHLSPHQLASLPSARLFWPCGWAHRRSPEWGEAVASIFLRQSDPAMLHGIGGTQPLVVYADTGEGFHAGSARIERVALGPGGRAWHRVRYELTGGSLRRWAISFGLPGEVVGVTGVRIHLHGADGTRCTIERPFDTLAFAGYEVLAAPWLRAVEDPAIVVVDMDPLHEWSGVILLDLFLASHARA